MIRMSSASVTSIEVSPICTRSTITYKQHPDPYSQVLGSLDWLAPADSSNRYKLFQTLRYTTTHELKYPCTSK